MADLIFANSKVKHVRDASVRIVQIDNRRTRVITLDSKPCDASSYSPRKTDSTFASDPFAEMSKFGPDQTVRFIPNKTIRATTTIVQVDHASATACFMTASAAVQRPRAAVCCPATPYRGPLQMLVRPHRAAWKHFRTSVRESCVRLSCASARRLP